MTTSWPPSLALNPKAELARRELERRRAQTDLAYLVSRMSAVNPRDGETFEFSHVLEPLQEGEVQLEGFNVRRRNPDWRWQRHLLDLLLRERRLIVLKGRQIGVTWLTLALDVAEALTMPGTASLLYRQRHDEAIDNVIRWWTLFESLPEYLRMGAEVIKPDRSQRPGKDGVVLRFPGGRFSEIVPMSSAKASGHGRAVRRIILDEAAYIEELAAIGAAVEPAAGDQARIVLISTAAGRANLETGEGNEFHRRWMTADNGGYVRVFFPYDVHPDRDKQWYDTAPEVQSLPLHLRHQQWPRDANEAFALSSRVFFDPETLRNYASRVEFPLYRADFNLLQPNLASLHKHDQGRVRVIREPVTDHRYAIGADVSTGRGRDFSAAYVIDLATMELVCEYHAKVDADIVARDLHFLGMKYNGALLAVENVGIGEAVIICLRDGKQGRRPYRNMYRHVLGSRPDKPTVKPYGFPTNTKTRPTILNDLASAIREETLPWVTADLLYEMETMLWHDTGPSPRAADGAYDDRVMACAIALEMYRQKAHGYVHKRRSKTPKPYPWME